MKDKVISSFSSATLQAIVSAIVSGLDIFVYVQLELRSDIDGIDRLLRDDLGIRCLDQILVIRKSASYIGRLRRYWQRVAQE